MTEPQTDHQTWDERLVRMANDIARNFTAIGHEQAAAATADHIHHFWDRRMKEKLFNACNDGQCGLTPVARSALQLLRDQGAPTPQTKATEKIPGASDSG